MPRIAALCSIFPDIFTVGILSFNTNLALEKYSDGSVATLKAGTEEAPIGMGGKPSGSQIVQLVNEPILPADAIAADPPCRSFAD
jgi:hypothetical protein